MSYKKILLLFSAVTVFVIALLLSFSYAYYVGTTNQNTSFNASTPSESLQIVFAQSNTLNVSAGAPILASDIETESSETTFSITYPSNLTNKDVAIAISISDINIDNMLKDTSFKWQLLNGTTSVAAGNFSSITNNSLVLMAMTNKTSLSKPSTETYKLRIWLEEICADKSDETTCSDYSAWQSAHTAGTETYDYNSASSTKYGQTRMMGKTFSGKIKVSSRIR